jgi:DNA-binding HxlR family transcriptional regulator
MLTQTLRRLERAGVMSHQAFAAVPVRVEYTVTPLGRTLTAALDGLRA